MRMLREWNRWRVGGAAGVLLGALLLALVSADNARPADEESKTALPADLAKIPSDGVFVASCRLAELWTGDILKSVREKYAKEIEQAPKEFQKLFGLSLDQIERMTLVGLDLPPAHEEQLFFARTVEAYDLAKILAVHKIAKAKKYKDQIVYAADEDKWAVYPLDEQSLVFGSYGDIRSLIDRPQPKTPGRLASALQLAAGKHTLVCGANVKSFMDALGEKLPGEVEPFLPLLQAHWGTAVVDVGKQSRLQTELHFESEKAAKEALKPGQTGLTLLRTGLEVAVAEIGKSKEATEAQGMLQLLKQFQEPLKTTKIEQRDKMLSAAVSVEIDPKVAGLTVVEMVQKIRTSAARVQSANNLKQLGLAMHNYHATYGHLPAQATYDKNGKPLLSWRVMLLPFIEQQNLYNQFHLDEPWDSEHNKKWLQYTVKVYTSPQQDQKSIENHLTHYQGFVGKGCFFEGKKGLRITDFTDGTSNTIMIVEASKGVPWTKPEDIPYDAEKPLPKLGLPGSTTYMAAICDGSVRTVSPKLTEKTLRLAITRNDGQPLGPDW